MTASVKSQVIKGLWLLTPDSTVDGVHYNDLLHMEAVRRLYKEQRNKYKGFTLDCEERLTLAMDVIDGYKQQDANNQAIMKLQEQELDRVVPALENAELRIARLKPWATVGRVGTFAVSLGVVGFGVAAGVRAIHSR